MGVGGMVCKVVLTLQIEQTCKRRACSTSNYKPA